MFLFVSLLLPAGCSTPSFVRAFFAERSIVSAGSDSSGVDDCFEKLLCRQDYAKALSRAEEEPIVGARWLQVIAVDTSRPSRRARDLGVDCLGSALTRG